MATPDPRPVKAHVRALLILGLPLIGSHVATVLIGVTDTLMLGRYSVEALAAGVLGSSYFFTFFILASGFAVAVLPKVSSALAVDDTRGVRRATRMGLWWSLILGVISYPVFWWSEPILLALGQDPEISALARDYLRVAGLAMVPALIIALLRSFLSGLELTTMVMVATLLGVLANAAINWVLIFGNYGAPELGILGAAIASLLVHILMAAVLWVYAVRQPKAAGFDIFSRLWVADWPIFWDIFRLGWPISLTMLAEVSLFSFSAILMGWLGKVPLAAHGIALQIASATFMIHLGLSSAATVRAGNAFGRKDPVGLRKGAVAAFALSGATVAVTVAAFLLLPQPLIGLFLSDSEPLRAEIMALGVVLLACAALFQVVDAMQVMALGLLRGMQDTTWPMVFAIIGYWCVGAPLAYVLGFHWGLEGAGVWLGLAAGLAVAGVLMTHRFVMALR